MSLIDMKNLDKLPPEQKKQFEQLLEAFPQVKMQSKMETSRELNTPASQEMKKKPTPPAPRSPDEDTIDYGEIERQQKEQQSYVPEASSIGQIQIDPGKTNFRSLQEVDKDEDEYKRRNELLDEEEARKAEAEKANVIANSGQRPPPPPPPPIQPKPQTNFSPVGKKHPIIQKMRASLGLEELEIPFIAEIRDIKYTMKRLMRQDFIKATALASLRSTDEMNLNSNIQASLVAFAITKIDDVSVADAFEIPTSDISIHTGKMEKLTPTEREDRGHQELFEFLIDSPTELVDTLVVLYEQHFSTISYLSAGTMLTLCPEANCQYKAITGKNEKKFCPHHGKELRAEGDLPNPF